jgi:hypothetical protein
MRTDKKKPSERRSLKSSQCSEEQGKAITPSLHHSVSAWRADYGLAGRALISVGLPVPTTTLPEMRELRRWREAG